MSAFNKSALGGILFEMRSWVRFLLPTSPYVAPYYPTPDVIIQRMMKVAEVGPKDVVCDLGCGDGRVLVAAAKLGARGVGYELDKSLANAASINVQEAKVDHLVKVVQGDASKADVTNATVVALYLSESGNSFLLNSVGPKLKPKTKIVSFFFPINGWEKNLITVDSQDNMSVYLYSSKNVSDGFQAPKQDNSETLSSTSDNSQ
uniref:Methyltransferase domain-containing protein n=1 Tax=Polytomella parva TaxID=51329 RepID=A0A7S0Y6Z5_9CHLO|mmetsp:Transcript_10237/g.18912  ORF Transcript_10237/g.18912 Transcript_10237/m.18912 type:complete len:204 (+) Transcript_10237:71-682(+)|eukprot:CAMPEP_0175058766 /NCGR_PEP_ID=MMETSP0052_2-20121109/12040_1 /TAXON_ID=51329 ORGANISM="Polytomella parva, Strain SAG 63-3" /NCGR_SAMPLE_ID=MMETSP0052_2 /ASSEMBLY_ACC=CAM_ASM_000194 /LENGTH=203 /DNA_ID=CAMNT_0016324203 /DNA_START=37 /DNA_END=648 /DNA_ORIENTATION=+